MLRRETRNGLNERALGMEAEMDGGVWGSESPLAPLKGGDQRVPWPVPAGHCSGQPDGAAACKRLWVIGYRMGLFGTVLVEGAAAAPERPNNKKDSAQVLHELNLQNLNWYE